jgi:homoaconitate hydratase family protein
MESVSRTTKYVVLGGNIQKACPIPTTVPPATIAQKILQAHTGETDMRPGKIVEADVDVAMSHDNTLLIARRFQEAGLDRIWDPSRVVVTLDHRGPAPTAQIATGHKQVRDFIHTQGIDNFYDVGQGICHQIMAENGHVAPGQIVVGTDSHTTTHGAFGAYAQGIGATEMAAVWATGRLWFRVPETVAIQVDGRLGHRVGAKDLILKLIGRFGMDGCESRAVEFTGRLFDTLSVGSRMTLANMSMEMGAEVAFTPVDDLVLRYLENAHGQSVPGIQADPDAEYITNVHMDADDLVPQVACPPRVDHVKDVTEVAGTRVDQVVIGTCTNGRLEDLEVAAAILDGERVSPSTRLLVIPASLKTFMQAVQNGTVERLSQAGAVFQSSGCGPCLGAHQGLLGEKEVCLSTTNRNFPGRMGHRESQVYLASPETAAATAIYGEITDPQEA